MNTNNLEINNHLTDDEIIDTAYDIFLELAVDNLDAADVILFNLQFEEIGAAELYTPDPIFWAEQVPEVDLAADDELFAEVIIGLTDQNEQINDIFARILLCRDKSQKLCHIVWKE